MKQILLFGAGKSATVLIDYLKKTAADKQWQVTIADANADAAIAKAGGHPFTKAVGLSVEEEEKRRALIEAADVVISLLPPALHAVVAADCVKLGRHLLTASYVDDAIRSMEKEIKEKGLLFLCEMGLDPGIDHMSAMQLVHRIKAGGGKIVSFYSHCGGLVAPEHDTNAWHYKISWNPRNVVLAGKAGAVYRERNAVIRKNYSEMFAQCGEVDIEGLGTLAYYPNRDSLGYIPVYELEEAETFVRTTLRYPAYCRGWQQLVELGFTEEMDVQDTDGVSISRFLQQRFAQRQLQIEKLSPVLQEQFRQLGWNDATEINKGKCSSADVLQFILEKQWALSPGDKDMIVMLHEIVYALNGAAKKVTSSLVVKGDDNIHTAMAKTVGLPLGIAATLLLEGKIQETGLHIPIRPGIYEPVLKRLQDFGIVFCEKEYSL